MSDLKWRISFIVAVMAAGFVARGEEKPAIKATTQRIGLKSGELLAEFSLVQLPAGKITLKDKNGENKAFEIKPIWMGKTEVTWNEFDIFWQADDLTKKERQELPHSNDVRAKISRPYEAPDRGWGRDGFPAGSMSFKHAQAYCTWLSKMTGHKYRLPTEAEWEYACRAGGAAVKPDKNQLEKMAWSAENSDQQTQHVAKKKPNAWGLYDMLGNVAEWVVMMDGTAAVAGGSYLDHAKDIHSRSRAPYNKSWQRRDPQLPQDEWWYWDGGHVGFRVVRED
jgi:formylglycine-generating enzyme required for sulfatase activity